MPVVDSAGPGITGITITLDDTTMRLTRGDGQTALLEHTGQPDRVLPLPRRELGDLLAEELQRLDSDETYAEALMAVTGSSGLSERPEKRTHVWIDPMDSSGPESVLVEGQPGPGA